MVAGAGLEPATFGLWAQRAAAAPPRDVENRILQYNVENRILQYNENKQSLKWVKSSVY